jgi:hypothetical protein
VAVMGGSFGGSAAADASITSQPGEINGLILLAAGSDVFRQQAEWILIEAREDTNQPSLLIRQFRVDNAVIGRNCKERGIGLVAG